MQNNESQDKNTKSHRARSATYRENNKQMAQLSQQRHAANIRERRASDPGFDQEKRKAEAERKKEYRKKKKLSELNTAENKENNIDSESDISLQEQLNNSKNTSASKSRQALAGALKRKKK